MSILGSEENNEVFDRDSLLRQVEILKTLNEIKTLLDKIDKTIDYGNKERGQME